MICDFAVPRVDGGGYNWMAPSLQSQDSPSFTLGSGGSAGETQPSSLLFNLMRPPKRPLRAGDGFGVGRLGVDETDSASMHNRINYPKISQSSNISMLPPYSY